MAMDYIVYQLQRIGEDEYTRIPGVLVERAAKTTHRHRQSDLLFIQLSFDGNKGIKGSEVEKLLKESSGLFFHTQGSVTRAIQQLIDHINRYIYERNAEWDIDGKQSFGSANVAVVHNGYLFIGQVGNAHVYRIGTEIYDRFGEEGEPILKLGISRRLQPRFYQSEISAGDLLIMSPKAHGSWKPYYLSNSNVLSIDLLKRRLHNQMIQDFSAVVIKVQDGSGNVIQGDWKIDRQETAEEAHPEIVEDELHSSTEIQNKQDEVEIITNDLSLSHGHTTIENDSKELSVQDPVEQNIPVRLGETESQSDTDQNQLPNPSQNKSTGFIRSVARIWMNGKILHAKMRLFFSRFSRKIFPNQGQLDEKAINLQGALVIVLPIILITSAILIFTRFGKEEQYHAFLSAAQEKASQAVAAEDVGAEKALWTEVLDLAIKAEKYLVTNESRQLFKRAQSIIDGMDLTARLDFHPAMTQSFPEGASITRIKSAASGVYLLESNSGNVLRVYVNTKGFYALDNEFKCTPGDYGLVSMGKIVDFVVLPANNMGYKVLAMDDVGNLLYCQPGEVPVSRTLTLPEGGWGGISDANYVDERLILVDSKFNNIWIYESNADNNEEDIAGIVFVEYPSSFFDEDVPDIGGAIRTVMNQEDLYILHEDGHMTICHYGYEDVRLTECEDPASFTDDRVSNDNKKPWIFMGTHFVEMVHTKLPNNSIYILDDISGALYSFSMQLNLENTLKPQINPDFPLPKSSPTGFGITQDQELLLAFNNQLFTAPLQ